VNEAIQSQGGMVVTDDERAAWRRCVYELPAARLPQPTTRPAGGAPSLPACAAASAGEPPIAFVQVASHLHANGYQPIPIKRQSKAPALDGWTRYRFAAGDQTAYAHCGAGLLTGALVAVDIDVMDAVTVKEVVRLAAETLGKPAAIRFGKRPKALLLYRTQKPQTKRSTKPITVPGSSKASKVEILGAGQQVVAFGIHPETGKPYTWHGGSPLTIPFHDLPAVTPARIEAFLQAAESLIGGTPQPTSALLGRTAASTILQGTVGDDLTSGVSGATEWFDNLPTTERLTEARAMLVALPDAAANDRTEWISVLAEIASIESLPWDDRVRLAWDFSQRSAKSQHESRESVERTMHGLGDRTNLNALAKRARRYGYTPAPSSAGNIQAPALSLTTTRDGRIAASKSNLHTALSDPIYLGVDVRFDTFRDCIMIAQTGTHAWREFRDTDYFRVSTELERGKGFSSISRETMRDAVEFVAKEASFDSAELWLTSLPAWDGVPRIERFLPDYFNSPDSPYTQAVSLYCWTALAGRVLMPGTKADMVPVLVGAQGCGKSSGVAALVPSPDHYAEIDLSLRDTDQSRKIRGKLVGEIAELRGLAGRDQESIKAFVTRQFEEWTPKYKEFNTKFPRRLLFIGTTNQDDFLFDETGNRRWLPVRVGRVDVAGIKRDLLQLWAEARDVYRSSGIAHAGAERLAIKEHAAHYSEDVWQEPVQKWLDQPVNGQRRGDAPFSIADLLTHGLAMETSHQNVRDQMRVARILKHLGYERRIMKARGIAQRLWTRKKGIAP
jgi:predicted P-loop ATPase